MTPATMMPTYLSQ